MQLCDRYESSKYGAAQCDGLSGGCLGASPNPCWPHVLWGALVNTGMPSSAHFGKDILIISDTHISTYAFSVRCLLLALYGVSPLAAVRCVLGFEICRYKNECNFIYTMQKKPLFLNEKRWFLFKVF